MQLVIAEKPSLARAIRAVVPAGVQVTTCFGHLLGMADPASYDPKWKTWSVDTLPIAVTSWKLVPLQGKADQVRTIGSLLKQADEVVHAGDPDREGQLLVDELLEYLGWHGPTRRLLITDVNPGPVRKAWESMRDNAGFRTLKLAAECRQRADWLVGMNLTRAASKLVGGSALISVGRVQTPTLALVVARHKAIANFGKEEFYVLHGRFAAADGREFDLKYEPDPRLKDAAEAKRLAALVTGRDTKLKVATSEKARKAPMPYDLGTFQHDAERYLGLSLTAALAALQAAYEAGWVTYPRSDCRYLPTEHKASAVGLARSLGQKMGIPLDTLAELEPRGYVYNSAKVKVHHAVVPTMKLPPGADGSPGYLAWKLVALHYLRTLLPDERYLETVVEAPVQAGSLVLTFKARGETISGGSTWRALKPDAWLPPRRSKKAPPHEAQPLPELVNGEAALCAVCSAKRGETSPPKLYTQASLRDDMEGVAKFAADAKMKAILKESHGIGTSATRGDIVQKLLARGFIIQVKGDTLDATPFGVEVIDALPHQLSDPVLTAAWEKALGMIADGQYDPGEFNTKVAALVSRHIEALKHARANGVVVHGGPSVPAKDTRGKKRSPKAQTATRRSKSKAAPAATRGASSGVFL